MDPIKRAGQLACYTLSATYVLHTFISFEGVFGFTKKKYYSSLLSTIQLSTVHSLPQNTLPNHYLYFCESYWFVFSLAVYDVWIACILLAISFMFILSPGIGFVHESATCSTDTKH